MAHKSVWEFKLGDIVFDKVRKRSAKVMVLNSNNLQIERRFYIQIIIDNLSIHEWRTAEQLGRI